ncbi:hypothetical protein B0G71_7486 [Paraburkholderia sp. BL27I4N3]|uniref:hypothetical protein n=1 Tax=Paraburkholderia sp. BL27I4N3 TaxID=1938805 RepID=UPI000E3913DD|nr:hypothetical protein [Paraburkholderia sp. BL27I4N3]REE24184.1 hypothetical protein B0G71_7486 [Paraburkholderia sp. BL27I4N3]
MRNLNKIIILALLTCLCRSTVAGEAIIFDQANLLAFSDSGRVAGFYDSEDNKFSCYFLFSQNSEEDEKVQNVQEYSVTKMLTFVPSDSSLEFEERYKQFDIQGLLYRKNGEWIIRTSRPQAGCGNATGVFEFDPPDIRAENYIESKRIPATGIRLVNTKTFFYDLRGGKFIARKGYLTKSNGVIVLRTYGQFSYVRFADPRANATDSGRVSTGWVRSANLVNPFPPTSRQ